MAISVSDDTNLLHVIFYDSNDERPVMVEIKNAANNNTSHMTINQFRRLMTIGEMWLRPKY